MPETNGQLEQASPVAVAYARSLLELANERNVAQEVGGEMKVISQLMSDNPSFKEFLANPSVGRAIRRCAVATVVAVLIGCSLPSRPGVLPVTRSAPAAPLTRNCSLPADEFVSGATSERRVFSRTRARSARSRCRLQC